MSGLAHAKQPYVRHQAFPYVTPKADGFLVDPAQNTKARSLQRHQDKKFLGYCEIPRNR